MNLLLSNEKSKFYKMRKNKIRYYHEYKDLVGKYIYDNPEHLHGVAFAFGLKPDVLLYKIIGSYCAHAIECDEYAKDVFGMSFKDLLKKDLSYLCYKGMFVPAIQILIEKYFGKKIQTLGGNRMIWYVLSDLSMTYDKFVEFFPEKNFDEIFMGLCVFIKHECSPWHRCKILLNYVPRVQAIDDLNVYVLNNIIDLMKYNIGDLSQLVDLYLNFDSTSPYNVFTISAYCWFYQVKDFEVPEYKRDYFKDDEIVNLYIINLYGQNFINDIDKQKTVKFIMNQTSWPHYFKQVLHKLSYINLNEIEILDQVSGPLKQVDDYHLDILQKCNEWLIQYNHEHLKISFIIQEILKILGDFFALEPNNLLKPYLNSSFVSNRKTAENGNISKVIKKLRTSIPEYLQRILILLSGWYDTIPDPLLFILQDSAVFFLLPPVRCFYSDKPQSLSNISDKNLFPDSLNFYKNVYFLAKRKFNHQTSNWILNSTIKHGTKKVFCSFYDYMQHELPFYLDIMIQTNNFFEAIFIFEYLKFKGEVVEDINNFLLKFKDQNNQDFIEGMTNVTNRHILEDWEPIHKVEMQYNNLVQSLNVFDYPEDYTTLINLEAHDDQYLLNMIKTCRSYNIILPCKQIPQSFNSKLEYLKYLRQQSRIIDAIHFSESINPSNPDDFVKLKLEAIKLKIIFRLEDSETIKESYLELLDEFPETSKVNKKLGDYCNELYSESDDPNVRYEVIYHYTKYLRYNLDPHKTMFPRILSFISVLPEDAKLEKIMSDFLEVSRESKFENILPHVQLVTSYLLTERMLFFEFIKDLLIGLLEYFPKRSLWYTVSSCFSANKDRSSIMRRLLQDYCKIFKKGNWLNHSIQLTQYLIHMSDAKIDHQISEVQMQKSFRKLARMENIDMLIPHKDILTPGSLYVNILRFGDNVTVLHSLVRPKKFVIYGDNGMAFNFLVKKDEDLRKDSRYLEVGSFINRRFQKLKPSKQRNLYIRTYNVIVLNEINGLIEWINNTVTLRKIIHSTSKLQGLRVSASKIKARLESADKHREYLKIVQEIPPVLHLYFSCLFSSPKEYFESRLKFAYTSAVMSMVGYAIGLGDRHCENVLIDVTTGDIVHVDFNCLFEKGKRLSIPEVVPFRLTQNIVRNMGITGIEGPFRKACEITLEILRKQYYLLDNLLESFLNDPLMEWQNTHSQATPEQLAKRTLSHVKTRVYGQSSGIPLSVEGTVQCAISEAMDTRNLCRMYIGWMPFY
eukprot:NODE_20_length_44879_cov_0.624654.p2 type:complete len:1242 gc:universal NODE_20_length_44879_cov_0.624654:10689-14414(+)